MVDSDIKNTLAGDNGIIWKEPEGTPLEIDWSVTSGGA